MFKKFTNGCVAIVNKYLPDPFLFAVILTFIVLILGIIFTGQGPLAMVLHWSGGFWNLLAFSMVAQWHKHLYLKRFLNQ